MNPAAAAQLGIKPFEDADYLQSDEDAALFTKAVDDTARARGMMQLACDTGITREGLYKALGEQGMRLCDIPDSVKPTALPSDSTCKYCLKIARKILQR